MRLPSSSSLPSPTASTLPFWGFSFAVSGRTMPEAVVASSSTALTIRRSPSGLSFIGRNLRWHAGRSFWHSPYESAKATSTIPRPALVHLDSRGHRPGGVTLFGDLQFDRGRAPERAQPEPRDAAGIGTRGMRRRGGLARGPGHRRSGQRDAGVGHVDHGHRGLAG